MAQSTLLLRDGEASLSELAPGRCSSLIQPCIDWSAKLRRAGRLLAADELADGGRVARLTDGRVTADGPYAETKENLGGYYTIEAENEAAALAIAGECPNLRKGSCVEVRGIVDHSQG